MVFYLSLKYDIPAHEYLGKMYLGKDNLTDEELVLVKKENFHMLYGEIPEEMKQLDFMKKVDEFQNKLIREI